MATPGSALVGYAILRANYNAQAPNYLDNFSPFVLSAIARSQGAIVERHVVAASIRDLFGIDIPALVIPRLLRRTTREGLTEPVGSNAVRLTQEALDELPDLASELAQYQQRQTELVGELAKFIVSHHPEHVELTTRDLGMHLAEFFDKHAVPLLGTSLGRGSSNTTPSSGMQYIVAAFVAYIAEHDQVRFSYVVEAAKGAMLASVLDLDTSDMRESLSGLTIVLDTPVAIEALGYDGPVPQRAMNHVLGLARSQGAVIGAFRHSLSELDGILESVENGLRRGSASRSTGSAYLHFAETGASPVDVTILRQKLEEEFTDAGILILERPGGYAEYGLDESKLEERIQARVHYVQDGTRTNDVHSLSAVHRLRRGDRSRSLEKSVAVMMTSNENLARGARDFRDEGSFPLAVTAEAVASMLWVRTPALAPDVPREVVLASAYVGMQPSATLWSRYVDEVEQLERSGAVSVDDAVILRSTRVGRDALMEASLGDENAVQADLPLTVLERVHEVISDPLRSEVETLEGRLADTEAVATHTSADWLRQVEAREIAEQEAARRSDELQTMQTRLTSLEREERAKVRRIQLGSEKFAKRVVTTAAWATRAIVAGVGLVALLVVINAKDPGSGQAGTLVAVLSVLGFIAAFIPPTGRGLDAWEDWLARSAKRRRLRAAGYEHAPQPSSGGSAQEVPPE